MNSVENYKNRILAQNINLYDVPLKDILIGAWPEYHKSLSAGPTVFRAPESEALLFYLHSHAAAQVVQSGNFSGNRSAVLDLYVSEATSQAARIFYYLLFICTREARHQHGNAVYSKLHGISKAAADFLVYIRSMSESSSVEALKQNPPEASVGDYASALKTLFFNGHWASSYGGKPWGNIADCLLKFVSGAISAEIMLDTAWTLAHNCGNIFNKGMLYNSANSDALLCILDVQRAGQIPRLIRQRPGWVAGHVDTGAADCLKSIQGLLGEEVCPGDVVDWDAVVAAGAVGKLAYKFKSKTNPVPVAPSKAPQAAAKMAILYEPDGKFQIVERSAA